MSFMNGTQKPSQIIVLQDAQHQNYQPLLRAYSIVKHIWTTNWDSPFFLRHLMALLLTTHYVHNIDDDIIFGKTTMQTINGMIDEYKSPVGIGGRILVSSNYTTGGFTQQFIYRKNMTAEWLTNTYCGEMEIEKIFWRYCPYSEINGDNIHYGLSNIMECGNYVQVMHITVPTDKYEDNEVMQ